MIEFLNKNGIINPIQHGFLEGKSCLTNLLETFEDWTTTLDEGYGLDVIYMDYKKAFDTVSHCRLIKKLEAYGIQGKVAQWVEAFLNTRTQWIEVGVGPCPEWCPPGVDFRAVTLHSYVNNIPDLVHCNITMFADNTKLFTSVRSQEYQEHLQCNIATLEDWQKIRCYGSMLTNAS